MSAPPPQKKNSYPCQELNAGHSDHSVVTAPTELHKNIKWDFCLLKLTRSYFVNYVARWCEVQVLTHLQVEVKDNIPSLASQVFHLLPFISISYKTLIP
jgi:hypothetical protein